MSSKPVKCVILGDCGVGKTSLVRKYISNEFGDHQSTLGASFWELSLDYTDTENNGHIIPIHIWDTAGQERYISLLPMYYRNSNIVFLCFDITDKITKIEKNIDFWIKQLETHNDNINRTVLLIATKIDLINDISLEYTLDALKLKYYNYSIITTSSKKNINIDEIFNIGLERAVEKDKKQELSLALPLSNTLTLSTIVPKKTIWKTYCSIL